MGQFPEQAIEVLPNAFFLSNNQRISSLGALLAYSNSFPGRKLDCAPFPSASGSSSKEIQAGQPHCASVGPQTGQLADQYRPALIYRLSYRRAMFPRPFF